MYIARSGNFFYVSLFLPNITDLANISGKGMRYIPIISTAAGAFVAYVILSFCIDLGVRTFKLAFYQIIAPIPIFLRIIPGKDNYFNKWLSATTKCFLEIFIRILLIEFVIFMFKNIRPLIATAFSGSAGFLGGAILIIGLFSFAKQAPKLFQEALALEGTGVKLGIKGKLEENLPLAAGAAVIGGAKSTVNSVTGGISEMNKDLEGKTGFGKFATRVKGIGKTSISAVTGGIGGAYAGAKAGKDAKDFQSMWSAGNSGYDAVSEKREKRANYRATHGADTGHFFKDLGKEATSHFKDVGDDAIKWVGLDPMEKLKKQQANIQEVLDARKEFFDKCKEEVLKQKNRRSTEVERVNLSNGDTIEFNNNVTLQNAIEQAKATGKLNYNGTEYDMSVDDIANLEFAVKGLQDKLTADYIKGYKYDSNTGNVDTRVYEANKSEQYAQKMFTAIKHNAKALNEAHEQLKGTVAAGSQLERDYQKSIDGVNNIVKANTDNYEDFINDNSFNWMDKSKKVLEGSNDYITSEINKEQAKKESK